MYIPHHRFHNLRRLTKECRRKDNTCAGPLRRDISYRAADTKAPSIAGSTIGDSTANNYDLVSPILEPLHTCTGLSVRGSSARTNCSWYYASRRTLISRTSITTSWKLEIINWDWSTLTSLSVRWASSWTRRSAHITAFKTRIWRSSVGANWISINMLIWVKLQTYPCKSGYLAVQFLGTGIQS